MCSKQAEYDEEDDELADPVKFITPLIQCESIKKCIAAVEEMPDFAKRDDILVVLRRVLEEVKK